MHDFKGVLNNGEEVSLAKYKGHPCVVVNVASKWGKTDSEYAALQKLFSDVSFWRKKNSIFLIVF